MTTRRKRHPVMWEEHGRTLGDGKMHMGAPPQAMGGRTHSSRKKRVKMGEAMREMGATRTRRGRRLG